MSEADGQPMREADLADARPHASVPDPTDFVQAYRRLVDYVGGGGGSDPADAADVLAMQMVLRIEKTAPPSRVDVLTAAARAVALCCLDERCADGQPWSAPMAAWCDARIRKIARRARGGQWEAAQQVWGVTATEATASARAIVPGRVGEVDQRIKRLQIGGTEVAGDLPRESGAVPGVLTLWVNPGLDMTVGKTAAQVGHGAMLGVKLMTVDVARDWYVAGCPIEVCMPARDRWQSLLAAETSGLTIAVRDAGFTEIAPGSVTVIAEAG